MVKLSFFNEWNGENELNKNSTSDDNGNFKGKRCIKRSYKDHTYLLFLLRAIFP